MSHSLLALQSSLNHHPLFSELKTLPQLRFFMESHVFAVWDFMSLLKRLQREITCVEVPWRPSPYPDEMVRLINQIVLGEESDVDQHGKPTSHFKLYLRAMEEVGASTRTIREFIQTQDTSLIPAHARLFTEFTIQTAREASVVEVAASFFYGREKLIPGMFEGIIAGLTSAPLQCPTLHYYLDRHVKVDAEEHGPLSEQCLSVLCGDSVPKREAAHNYGIRALEARRLLWDRTLERLKS